MIRKTAFIHDPGIQKYRFHDSHPFNQRRIDYTIRLLREAGALTDGDFLKPAPVDESVLLTVHNEEYTAMVKALSAANPEPGDVARALRYGLGPGDTPFFPGMHQAALIAVAGSVAAADYVMAGENRSALHLGGGLHHAFPGQAAGFCVYNDAAVAIARLRDHYRQRVLYIDTDVHHGDGVQAVFYTDPEVCTFSIHETGKYLFPGTGFASERGEAEGFGYCFNLPLDPFTEDESWLSCFREAATRIADFFKPDVIVSQHGCDAHYFDPLSHQHCSMEIYLAIPQIIRELADKWCGGRWIALGGGGYDIRRVVPRAWSLLWLVMTGHEIADKLRRDPGLPLPESWLEAMKEWGRIEQLPKLWLDDKTAWEKIPRRQEIERNNERMKELALLYLSD